MRSCARSFGTICLSEAFNSGSLSVSFIDPETSTRKTRLAAGISVAGTSYPCTPTSSNWRSAFHGAGASSVVTLKGCSCVAGSA
jgi:hypothetical protein